MTMGRLWLAPVVAAGLMVPVATVGAAEASTAVCTGTWNVPFSPGISSTFQRSTFTTSPTPLTCVGQVRGHEVTGPGSFVKEGSLEGTVLMGAGGGTEVVTVPTTAGPQTLTFAYTLEYGPGYGIKRSASLVGPYTFLFVPAEGDGITSPVTRITATGWFIVKS